MYNAGSIPSQRTKALAPHRSIRTDEDEYDGDKPVESGCARKAGPETGQSLISRIMAPPLLSGVEVVSANVFGAVRMKVWPTLIFFRMADTIKRTFSTL